MPTFIWYFIWSGTGKMEKAFSCQPSQSFYEVSTLAVPILQMGKLSTKELVLALGHRVEPLLGAMSP